MAKTATRKRNIPDDKLCTLCHNGALKQVKKDYQFKFKGDVLLITGVPAVECDTCIYWTMDTTDILKASRYIKESGRGVVSFKEVG